MNLVAELGWMRRFSCGIFPGIPSGVGLPALLNTTPCFEGTGSLDLSVSSTSLTIEETISPRTPTSQFCWISNLRAVTTTLSIHLSTVSIKILSLI